LVTGGDLITYPGVAVRPKPAREGGPPIWIGAFAERAIRRSGRIADGLLANEVDPSALARQISWVKEELHQAGRDPARFAFGVYLDTFAWEADDAWERVRDYWHYVSWKYEDMASAKGRSGPPQMPPPLAPADEELGRRQILVGRPQHVAEHIASLRDAAGGDLHFVARLYWPGMDLGVQREAMAVFAERVIPHLR
jgi:alkanesulfonate monooxygenase SsuD/methylene tetrahydromethanopterin reductase-like flavin-dependent oxidoreductase (luciferase family)